MEASSAYHWAHKLRSMGFDARLIAANFVGPYRTEGKGGKNNATDAAICEAASRPNSRGSVNEATSTFTRADFSSIRSRC